MSHPFAFTRTVRNLRPDLFDSGPPSDSFYEHEYVEMNPTLHAEDADAKFRAVLKALMHLPESFEPKTVADVGCGLCSASYRLLDYLAREHGAVVWGIGVDISETVLARGEWHERLVKLRADCADIPLPAKSVSVSLCLDCLEHTRRPLTVVKEVARISQYAIFKVPLELCLYTVLRGGQRRLNDLRLRLGHIHHFSRKDVHLMIGQYFDLLYTGFERIPCRPFFTDIVQRALIGLGLNSLFAKVFGGFIVILGEARAQPGHGSAS